MKRFDIAGCTGYCNGGYHMKEDVDGEYVTYESHVEAMKRIAGAPVAQGLTLTGDQIRAAVRDARMTCGPSDAPQPSDYVQAGARAILAQAAPSPLAMISWNGFNLRGDEKSIKEVHRLIHRDGRCDDLDREISEMRKNAAPSASASPAALTDEMASIIRRYMAVSRKSGTEWTTLYVDAKEVLTRAKGQS